MAIGGNGTQANPYTVRTYNDLVDAFWACTSTNYYVKLVADVDANGVTWTLPGSQARLDMNNHTIRNVVIDRTPHGSEANTSRLMPAGHGCTNGIFENVTAQLNTTDDSFWRGDAINMRFKNCTIRFASDLQSSSLPISVFATGDIKYTTFQGSIYFPTTDSQSYAQFGTKVCFIGTIGTGTNSTTVRYSKFDIDVYNNVIAYNNVPVVSLFYTNNRYNRPCEVNNCLITGKLHNSTASLNGFIGADTVSRFQWNIIDFDVSDATMSASDPACNIVNADNSSYSSYKTIINTDSFAASGLNGKVSSGDCCIDLTTAQIHSRTAINATGWTPNLEYVNPRTGTITVGVYEGVIDYKSLEDCTGVYPEYEYYAWRQYPDQLPYMYPFNQPAAPPPFAHIWIGDEPVDAIYRGDTQITDIYVGNTYIGDPLT